MDKAVIDSIESVCQARFAQSVRLEQHRRQVRLGQQVIEDDAYLGIAAAITRWVAAPTSARGGHGGIHQVKGVIGHGPQPHAALGGMLRVVRLVRVGVEKHGQHPGDKVLLAQFLGRAIGVSVTARASTSNVVMGVPEIG